VTRARRQLARAAAALALACGLLASTGAGAHAAQATWRLEQPPPPPAPAPGGGLSTPIGLGRVGDVEFLAPNRGLLITSGNGSTIPAGVWAYDGSGWKELATECGATDGRIAWSGQDEFWTVSDGRPGQTRGGEHNEAPPLEDDTLCHFAGGQIVGSYASPAFQATSYQAMHAAGCLASDDCWFSGAPLPTGAAATGSFHLHWNGSSVAEEPYEGEEQTVEGMTQFGGRLYEGVRVTPPPARTEAEPPVLHAIDPAGSAPTFEGIPGVRGELESPDVPLYGPGVFVEAMGSLRVSGAGDSLWAAAGPVSPLELPEESLPGQVTVARLHEGVWRQLLGPLTSPTGQEELPGEVVSSIAAEPDGEAAWLALDNQADAAKPSPETLAKVAHVAADGTVSEVQTLPSAAEQEAGIGPKGAARQIVCPAADDCWMVTTQGWLFHLTTGEESLSIDDEGFSSLITSRPADKGIPQLPPDLPPAEESGLPGELPVQIGTEVKATREEGLVAVPLLTSLHSRLIHRTTLELRFHLAVTARVRLIAKRKGKTVASTPTKTLGAGSRKLLLRLNPKKWPTKLDLQTHALAPLPTESDRASNVETISTRLAFPGTRQLLETGPRF
jgi:hypothetical protein